MYKGIGIISIDSYVPQKVITNFDLEKIVDTTDEWIRTRTGIKKRHILDENEATSDLATKAAQRVLARANMKPQDIDCIIVATASPDMFFPSTGCIVQRNIGAVNAFAMDVSAGCAGFIYITILAAQMIASGFCKHILVIGAEGLTRFIDWEDRATCVLFGDGAGAAIMGKVAKDRGILGAYLGSNGEGADLLKLPAGGTRLPASVETVATRSHYIKMQGNEIFKYAVREMSESVIKSLASAGLTIEDVDLFVPHQANKRIIDAVAKKLGISEEKVMVNIEEYGNTSAASIPIAIGEAVEQKKLKEGMILATSAFGAGFTFGSFLMRW